MEYIFGIIVTLLIYGIIIKKVDSGRCFQYEFIVKTLIIIALYVICFVVLFIHFNYFSISAFIMLFIISIPVLMYKSLKYTIQRFYDLGLNGWYILLKLIPILSILVTIYLYFKKGNSKINEYDEAINYKKIFKEKRIIDIYDNIFFIDNYEYHYEKYMGKYIIKISYNDENNFFTEYLINKFNIVKNNIHKTIEITNDEFINTIKSLKLIIVDKSFYINLKELKIFIRKENFKYTIILEKYENNISKELFEAFNFIGSYFEDDEYIYFNKITKEELIKWINNIA